MRRSFAAMLLASVSLACAARQPRLATGIPEVRGELRTAYALQYIDVAAGSGALAEFRRCVHAHYTGWLPDGTKFDSSRDTMPNGTPRSPIAFPLGSRRVILGWDTGFDGMRVGGKRRLFIPYQLAYGETARGETIPARSPLIFDVELMAVTDTLPRSQAAAPGAPPSCADWSQVGTGR
jgi:peptidylprolyl isomerase